MKSQRQLNRYVSADRFKSGEFGAKTRALKEKIEKGFDKESFRRYKEEFAFFEDITNISEVLLPAPKEERKVCSYNLFVTVVACAYRRVEETDDYNPTRVLANESG